MVQRRRDEVNPERHPLPPRQVRERVVEVDGRAHRLHPVACGTGSWAGRRLRMGGYVTGTRATDGPTAAGGRSCRLSSLLAYFDYPAEHWKHLRTTNPIESTFATVRLREGVTKGAGSRTAGLTMAFKLLTVAEGHWRCLDAAELVPLVRAGVAFEDGVQIEPQKKRKKAVA